MITFKSYLAERAMNKRTYIDTMKRLGKGARIGFEIEILVPEDSYYWEDPNNGSTPKNTQDIDRFDSMSEFEEYFNVSSYDKRSIDNDYGSWVSEQEDQFVDDHWEEYDDEDEDNGRRMAKRDFDDRKYTWDAWFNEKFSSGYGSRYPRSSGAAKFVNEYGLEPKYGWYLDSTTVYTSDPNDDTYDEGWHKTAGKVANALSKVVTDQVHVNQDPTAWHIYQDESIKETGEHGRSTDSGMRGYGLEIVSPPMELHDGIDKLQKVLYWCDHAGIETNGSTGLHVNVSLPDMSQFDPLKLVLFMGDHHVLSKFNRLQNTYSSSQLRRVIDSIQTTGQLPTNADEIKKLATAALEAAAKHSSVNLKHMKTNNPYLEFRAMGGENYHKRIDDIEEAIGRWLTAFEIASDPDRERQAYLKKMMGLMDKTHLSKSKATIQSAPFIDLVKTIGGKMFMDMIASAESKTDKIHAAATVFSMFANNGSVEKTTFDQNKGARDFLKGLQITPEEVLAYAENNTKFNVLTKGLKLFKLLK